MNKYKAPTWLAVLVTAAIFFGNWYVNRDMIDKTDFQKVVYQNVSEKNIQNMNAYEKNGFALYETDGDISLAVFEKINGNWNYITSAQLMDKKWGISNLEGKWIYLGFVKEPTIESVIVGGEKVQLYKSAGSIQYWVYHEPTGYNYPIKAVYENGTEQWIKEK